MWFQNSFWPVQLGAWIGAAVIWIGFGSTLEAQNQATSFHPTVPTTWDEEALDRLELPLAGFNQPVKHVSVEFYNRIPVFPIQKAYPIFHPSKEPTGYIEELQRKEPAIEAFDATQFQTESDWINAGKIVFHAPDTGRGPSIEDVHDPNWYKVLNVPVAADGTLPGFRYVIRKKGQVSIEGANCARCHTRVLKSGPLVGTLITGAQGNFPLESRLAQDIRARAKEKGEKSALELARTAVTGPHMPWNPKSGEQHDRMTLNDILTAMEAVPPGVAHRVGSGIFYPPKLPDLIGIRDRKYLDATGLVRHLSPGDLMRYATLIGGRLSGMERYVVYGDWRPFGEPPDPNTIFRYSDEQLYALTQYIYSLKPPANPHLPKLKEEIHLVEQGKTVFESEDCARCHTPPFYTNNKLTPVDGFDVPAEHPKTYDIEDESVGTDPNLALNTRKGTGYYRVPSLKGVWYRGPFEHNGSIATLEDWFDPRRLEPNFVPTGWKGPPGTKQRPVKGHEFGLDLSDDERRALIAFLRTL